MVTFKIAGDCVAKQRPRMVNGHVFTPKQTKVYEAKVRDSLVAETRRKVFPIYEEGVPLQVNIVIVRGVPKSYTKSKREKCLKNEIRPTGKSDLDNYVKSILDGMNGYAFADDSAVCRIKAEKRYGEESYTLVQIFEIGEDTDGGEK